MASGEEGSRERTQRRWSIYMSLNMSSELSETQLEFGASLLSIIQYHKYHTTCCVNARRALCLGSGYNFLVLSISLSHITWWSGSDSAKTVKRKSFIHVLLFALLLWVIFFVPFFTYTLAGVIPTWQQACKSEGSSRSCNFSDCISVSLSKSSAVYCTYYR